MLHAKAPLLHHGGGIAGIHRANVEGAQILQIDGTGIEKVGWKSIFCDQHRSGVAGQRLVDQERGIQGQLVFAAESLKQRVVDAVAAAECRLALTKPCAVGFSY